MNGDPLSDLLRSVRLRGAVFYYLGFRGPWAAQAQAAAEIADAVLPGCEHVMEFHMLAKGSAWSAVLGSRPVRLGTGDIIMLPQGDAHVVSSASDIAPEKRPTEWVFAQQDWPKPVPIASHQGVMSVGTRLPVEEAESIVVCGFLGCDLRPFNPLVDALPRMLHLPARRAGS